MGCSKQKESDDLAKAQDCLDKVPESNPTAADECMTYVEKYTSQQADILKCSILITSGGLMESRIVKGYSILKDTTQTNKVGSFMAVLGLTLPTVSAGYTKAVKANEYCISSGVSGLKYLSAIVLAGTSWAKTMSDLNITGLDPSDPSSVNTAVTNLLTDCAGSTPNTAVCQENASSVGSAVLSLSTSYCANPSKNKDVCDQVSTTLAQSGTDPTDVGLALYCVIAKKTYNPSTQQCQ
jgi:hypothetical protein